MKINEKQLANIVLGILEKMQTPESHLTTITRDFENVGIEYCIIGGIALGVYNYSRRTKDIDFLVSKKTHYLIEKELLGRGYTIRLGSTVNLDYHSDFGIVEVDILVEGSTKGSVVMPNPLLIRRKISGVWYADLPKLIDIKIGVGRPEDIQDVIKLIRSNILDKSFANNLQPQYREQFKKLVKEINGK